MLWPDDLGSEFSQLLDRVWHRKCPSGFARVILPNDGDGFLVGRQFDRVNMRFRRQRIQDRLDIYREGGDVFAHAGLVALGAGGVKAGGGSFEGMNPALASIWRLMSSGESL